jgi:hypothetical protein
MHLEDIKASTVMKKHTILLMSVALILCFCTPALSQKQWVNDFMSEAWLHPINEIHLLRDTKADVEKILGKPEELGFRGADFIEYYTIPSGRVAVSFTTSECLSKDGRKIPEGVVEEIDLQLNQEKELLGLKIPLAKFKKSVDEDAPTVETYTNNIDGIAIEVQRGKITGITIKTPKRLRLRCAN